MDRQTIFFRDFRSAFASESNGGIPASIRRNEQTDRQTSIFYEIWFGVLDYIRTIYYPAGLSCIRLLRIYVVWESITCLLFWDLKDPVAD